MFVGGEPWIWSFWMTDSALEGGWALRFSAVDAGLFGLFVFLACFSLMATVGGCSAVNDVLIVEGMMVACSFLGFLSSLEAWPV